MAQFPNDYERLMATWNPTWSEFFLSVPGVKWADVADPKYAHIEEIAYWVAPGVVIILALRWLLEDHVLHWLGHWLGIKEPRRSRPTHSTPHAHHEALEQAYRQLKGKHRTPSPAVVKKLGQETDMSQHQVARWFRRRRRLDVTPPIKKFAESAFKVLFYTGAFGLGMATLWPSTWLWDLEECWRNMPFHTVDRMSKLYYIVELSYYSACLITLPFDNKRKDFTEMIIHHVATVGLLVFSYTASVWRGGTLIMAVHDVSDIFLELAKCFNYAKFEDLANNTFVVFAVVFFVSRICMLPFVIHSTLNHTVKYVLNETLWEYVTRGHFVFVHMLLNSLLLVLFALHVFWMSIIVRMAIKFVGSGTVEKDDRSDDDYNDTDDEHENGKKSQ